MFQVFVLLKIGRYIFLLSHTLFRLTEWVNLIQDEVAEAYKREADRSREAIDAAEDSLLAERQRLAAAEARHENDVKRGGAEAVVLREQLDNAVRGQLKHAGTCC